MDHNICDMLGLPRNVYGIISNTFETLNFLLVHLKLYKDKSYKMFEDYMSPNEKALYDYLVSNNLFHYLQNALETSEFPAVTDQHFINYALVKYFSIDWNHDDTEAEDIVNSFRVPVELLACRGDVTRLKASIGKTTFRQIEIIPKDIIEEHKIKKDKAIEYGLEILQDQVFYEDIAA